MSHRKNRKVQIIQRGVVQNKNIPTLVERNGSCGYGEHMVEIYI